MKHKVELTHTSQVHTAVVRGQVRPRDLARFVPAACGEVWSFIKSAGLKNPGRHVALYLDHEGHVEVGAEVGEPFTGTERIACSSLPAGLVAHAVHFGPYDRIFEAHRAVREWCAEHHKQPTGVTWEIYGHWQESWNHDPFQIRTDVFHLLADNDAGG